MNSDLVSLFTPYKVATPSNLPIVVKKQPPPAPLAAAEPPRAASTSRKHNDANSFVENYFKNSLVDKQLKYKNIRDSMIKIERESNRSRSQRMAQKQQILQMISHVENMPAINEKIQNE
jgi:hypothetical protein